MKLSCVLLVALAPVNAVDSQPQAANLRGIAAIALSDGEESAPPMVDGIDFVKESRYGPHTPQSCKKVSLWCSTDPDAMASHKCCNNLTCQPSDHVKSQALNGFDGTCVANGPAPVAPNTAGGRYGQACRMSGEQCNDTSGSTTTKCCNDGGSYNLVCSAGTCVEATAPGEIDEEEG